MSSYVTEAEAEIYFGNDPRATVFLADEYLDWYLANATQKIDALPFRGKRYEPEYYEDGVQVDIDGDGLIQTLEFPRVIDGVIQEWDNSTNLPIVPDRVKTACLEEALAIYLAGVSGGITELQSQGIQSFSVGGKLSYTFAPGAGSQCLQSTKAAQYIRRYLGGKIR